MAPPATSPARGTRGFTLMELGLVIAVLALMFALIGGIAGRRTIRGNTVRAAVDELVSTLRQARQMAMDHKAVYGVTFNIANAAGSTGQVLNNRGGGHWYRIIGPNDPGSGSWAGAGGYSMPVWMDREDWWNPGANGTGDVELGWWLSAVQSEMVGPKHYLPKGEARFVALNDEDNGNNWCQCSCFPATYPRPWFGDFVQGPGDAQPRLYTWGGYDQGFTDFWQGVYWRAVRPPNINFSAFYYQGDDPPIVGCVNPQDRYIIDDPAGTSATAQRHFRLFTQGEPRPLINGDWLDFVVIFNPDGSATTNDFLHMRHQYGQTGADGPGSYFWNDNGSNNLWMLGPGDMCNFINGWVEYYACVPYNNRSEASSYADVTGTYYITMGVDMPDDTVSYPSAQAALEAMTPLYRVGVTRLGEIKAVRVSTIQPAGAILDAKWQGGMWNNYNLGYNGFWNNLALSATGQTLMPAEDFVTPQMMTNMQWWLDP